MTRSHVSGSDAGLSASTVSSARSAVRKRSLWQVMQYWLTISRGVTAAAAER